MLNSDQVVFDLLYLMLNASTQEPDENSRLLPDVARPDPQYTQA